MDRREREMLDRHITGNYGEDQFKGGTMNTTILLRHLRSTKGAEVYQEIDKDDTVLKGDNSLVGTLYLRKIKLDGVAPQELKVTIESEGL